MLVHSIATKTNQRMNFGCPGENLIDNAIIIIIIIILFFVQQHLTIEFYPIIQTVII